MFRAIREVSMAVQDLDRAVETYRTYFDLEPSSRNVDERPPIQSRSAMYRVGDSCLALMEATAPESPIGRFLERRGEGLFSVAVSVEDLEAVTAQLRDRGVHLVLDRPMLFPDFPAFDRTYSLARMNFVRPRDTHGVLIELQELAE
jgi:methylmalonyl-CoA/ethylmalonyl-CoA epimerase